MKFWHFYFIAVTILHWRGNLHAAFWPNAALLLWILFPLPKGRNAKTLQKARAAIAGLAAFVILWNESWLPSMADAWEYLSDPVTVKPSPAYLWQFFKGSFNPWLTALLVLLAWGIRKAEQLKIRLTFVVVLALGVIAGTGPSVIMSESLDAFYKSEAARKIPLVSAGKGAPDFDVVLIQICSFSWDDVRAAGESLDGFFSKFDVVFTRFNSATSHSNPGAIRLLRAPCGQRSHDGLYLDDDPDCYLMDSLRRRGFATASAMNFPAKDGDFGPDTLSHGKADGAISLEGLKREKLNFDNSDVFADKDVLGRWWQSRLAANAPAAALYYNSTSLHQGGHWPPDVDAHPWKDPPEVRYATFFKLLTGELDEFFGVLEKSGRKVVVIVVGEHGAALRGSRIQAPDLREIPVPSITNVPAAIRLIGPGRRPYQQKIIDKPVSYFALAHMIAGYLEHSPFSPAPGLDPADTVPETPFVAETNGMRVVENHGGFMYQAKHGAWVQLPADVVALGKPHGR
jgi:cellulose synthase operon protein YhjU